MLETLNVSPFGVFHTIISLIAVLAGLIALIRQRVIDPKSVSGQIYTLATILTCLTGFGIFRHGGFGKAHVLGIVTLVVLGIAMTATLSRVFGAFSKYVEIVGYSLTFFFHMIPLVNETATRFPLGAPLATDPESPALQAAGGILFLTFLIGAFLQVASLRRSSRVQTLRTLIGDHEEFSLVEN